MYLTQGLRRSVCLSLLGVLASCAQPSATVAHRRVIAHDYAFAFPPSVPAGMAAFRLVNEGSVRHEVQLYRFKPGIPRDSASRMLTRDEIPDSAVDVDGGVLIAGPADSTRQELLVRLEKGDVYALECVFRNTPDEPRHRDLGMFAIFQVE